VINKIIEDVFLFFLGAFVILSIPSVFFGIFYLLDNHTAFGLLLIAYLLICVLAVSWVHGVGVSVVSTIIERNKNAKG
jgi:hypothetical protein